MRSTEEIFNDRSCTKFANTIVSEELLIKIYNLMKLGPTSANSCPLRIYFIKSLEEKEKLYPCLMAGNLDSTKSAPINALFAYDKKFFNLLPQLFPHAPKMQEMFKASGALALDTAQRNSSLQAAYFMIIARSYGLACGPMSGFDAKAVNETFFSGTDYEINFICNFGYPAEPNPYNKLPRLEFNDACTIL